MEVSWLQMSIRGIIGVCMIVSVVECAVDGGESPGGLRLVCGTAVAASVVRMAVDALRNLL